MNRSSLGPADHVATVSVSFELAVDSPERPPHFHECHRNGEIKRVYESPAPEHCFHLQYQLLPPGGADDAAGRDGERKGGPIYSKSDVVTFGVVSKVYTEQVTRVVRCWNEKEDEKDEKEEEEEGEGEKEESEGKEKKTESRTHFGWRHKHTFPVSEELLLQLYDHTMEVRLWNSREKLAPRARFDRPRAFRLPIPPPASKEEDEKETSQSGRPDKFPLVRQQAGQTASTRGKRRARTRKKASNVSSISEEDTDPDLSTSITEVPHSPTKEAVSLDENVEGTDQAPTTDQGEPKETTEDDDVPTDQSEPKATNEDNDIPRDQNESGPLLTDQTEPPVTTAAGDGAPLKDHEMLGSVVLNHSSIFALHDSHVSKSKSRRMAAEAAEKARVEREGLVLLRLKMADLFAKRDSISAKMDTSTDNIRVFEVSVSLESPLMSDAHRRTLNPTVITVHRAINLPPPSLPPLPSLTPSPSTAQSSCPFARLVYLTSVDEAGLSLVARILDLVNDLNIAALGLDVLPRDMLPTALSTYKLTKWEMEGKDFDVVTGVQVRDRDVSLLVLEGPGHGAIYRLWTRLPRHSSQDAGLVKTFYNSGCVFSRRLYGQLDVDLPLIFLPHSLSSLTQLSPLFIRGAVTPGALRALLCLSEMSACGGGMADLVRNSLFPSCEEMAALAAQFGVLPGGGELDLLDPGLSPRPEGEVSRSHTPVPPGNVTGEVRRRRRKRMKMPLLDMENRWYERMICERKDQETINHIDRNIALTHSLSEKAAQLPVHVRRRKTRMRSLTDSHTVHLYSSQTFNSAVLARARMRAELASDHTHQLYTYCQDYHSMTFEPFDPPNTQHTQRDIDRRKWRTREGFVYPGVSTARRSNTHPETPHPARAHDLNQPFKDGVLHANTDKPTVERLHFPWEQRGDDFSLHYHVPPEFGPRPPISIHLTGERRAAELQHFQKLDSHDWESKVVVKDTRFYTHRRGIRTELARNGDRARESLKTF
ncbi:Uncharacterized protein FLJ43738 [Geodia barretti]|uniref:Uncharacterized protein FLJ43738 n=1 Tax=Geodia barretti TaxID=519541 RepID=A0AA35SYA8_GEOBA|nr:Uncharacterized protein FLJ43738 [Geodia barretti]